MCNNLRETTLRPGSEGNTFRTIDRLFSRFITRMFNLQTSTFLFVLISFCYMSIFPMLCPDTISLMYEELALLRGPQSCIEQLHIKMLDPGPTVPPILQFSVH